MVTKNGDTTATLEREVSISRTFDAPRSLVFKVWTQPEHFARWLGPKDFTTTFCQMDARLGGTYRACIQSPEGKNHWMQGVYREIVEPERLVFTFAWEDEDGKPKHDTLVTVTFAEHEGKTTLTFHQAIFKSVEARDSHLEGWTQCLERLAGYLSETSKHGALN